MPDTVINVDETLGKVTIVTRSRSTIVIDDPNKSLMLQDMNGNKIEMNSEGITIASVGDLVIRAAGKVVVEAGGNVETSARGGDIKSTGLNINHTAQMTYVAKGAASAELSATGETIVRGAMVMIN